MDTEPGVRPETQIHTIEEAVTALVDKDNHAAVIQYLQAHPDDASELTLQAFETYQKDRKKLQGIDVSGIIQFAGLLKSLLPKPQQGSR
jgi:2-oxo-4-hydroxy-4-carboxy--5-ureidoimidazoline (OHCU) decarboxylase